MALASPGIGENRSCSRGRVFHRYSGRCVYIGGGSASPPLRSTTPRTTTRRTTTRRTTTPRTTTHRPLPPGEKFEIPPRTKYTSNFQGTFLLGGFGKRSAEPTADAVASPEADPWYGYYGYR